ARRCLHELHSLGEVLHRAGLAREVERRAVTLPVLRHAFSRGPIVTAMPPLPRVRSGTTAPDNARGGHCRRPDATRGPRSAVLGGTGQTRPVTPGSSTTSVVLFLDSLELLGRGVALLHHP